SCKQFTAERGANLPSGFAFLLGKQVIAPQRLAREINEEKPQKGACGQALNGLLQVRNSESFGLMLAGLAPEEQHVYSNWLMRHMTGPAALGESPCRPNCHNTILRSHSREPGPNPASPPLTLRCPRRAPAALAARL